MVLVTSLAAVTLRQNMSPGLVGLAVTYSLYVSLEFFLCTLYWSDFFLMHSVSVWKFSHAFYVSLEFFLCPLRKDGVFLMRSV